MNPNQASQAAPKRRGPGASCLLWLLGACFCLLVAGVAILGGVYAGWNTGLATARAQAAVAAASYARQQCERIPADLEAGKLPLARSRLEDLRALPQTPACLPIFAPTATAAASLASLQPSPSASPWRQPTRAPTEAPVITPPMRPATVASDAEYDLEALLAEARRDLGEHDYASAIDTLDAIISLDPDFQRELVRRLILDALKAQALGLFRSGNLSEAIILTERAESFGDIGELNYERLIALLYLDGQRLKRANPALAAQKLRQIVYDYGSASYMNGAVIGELQEALLYYADALAFQGDACPALEQYESALSLQPGYSRVSPGELAAKRDAARVACNQQTPQTGATTQGPGVRAAGTIAPVGQPDG